MQNGIFSFSPLAAFSAGAVVPTLALLLGLAIDRHRRTQTEKPPQTEKLLRPPGHSLSQKLDQLSDSIIDYLLLAIFASGVATMAFDLVAIGWGRPIPVSYTLLHLGIFLPSAAAGLWSFSKLVRLIITARHCRLGLRGEQAVAECLNEVADAGYRFFHDLPAADNWNIDHVAVGPQGVFLIETKARNRRGSRRGHPAHEVHVHKKTLHFPTCVNSTAVPQAERSARWLANCLEKKTGEKVAVAPIVVLPGWFVTYKDEESATAKVKVLNPKMMITHLREQPQAISASQLKRIITALDEKCRDIEF